MDNPASGGAAPRPAVDPETDERSNRKPERRESAENQNMTTIATEPRETATNEPTGAPAPARRRSPIPLLILGTLLLGGAGWGVQRYRFAATHVSTDNAQVDGHITAIAPRVQAFVDRSEEHTSELQSHSFIS